MAPTPPGPPGDALGVIAPGLIPAIPGVSPPGPCVPDVLAWAEIVAKPLINAVHTRETGINRSFIAAATRRSLAKLYTSRILDEARSGNSLACCCTLISIFRRLVGR